MNKHPVSLTEYTSCGGCAAKLGPGELSHVLGCLPASVTGGGSDKVLVGLPDRDDALVYRLCGSQALVQTVDFFPPIVDDPYTYGSIAAANATSDIYAMGGDVLWALNIVAFPQELPVEVLCNILRGGADKIAEAGGFVGGGHSIRDSEPKYGMCVTGLVDPRSLWRKLGARPGDAVLLTKPIGTGVILAAAKRGLADIPDVAGAVASMTNLNRQAAGCLRSFMPSAVTDVTGFGLLGHALEMAVQSNVCIEIRASSLPLLEGALNYARAGHATSAHPRIASHIGPRAEISDHLDSALVSLLIDPQTSGGLLIAIARDHVEPLSERFAENRLPIWHIGEVHQGAGRVVAV